MKNKNSLKTPWRIEFLRNLILFIINGSIYYLMEYVWKTNVSGSATHWSMFILGGVCGLAIGQLNEHLPWEMGILKQGFIGACLVTTLEFIFGVILNIWLQLGIWDYSMLPLNVMGQICLPFTIAWFFLAMMAVVLDDYLRYYLFKEEKPHYHLLDHEAC